MKTKKVRYQELQTLAEAEKNALIRLWKIAVEENFFEYTINKVGEDKYFWDQVEIFLHPDLRAFLDVGEMMLRDKDPELDTPKSSIDLACRILEQKIKNSDRWRGSEHNIHSYLSEMMDFADQYFRKTFQEMSN